VNKSNDSKMDEKRYSTSRTRKTLKSKERERSSRQETQPNFKRKKKINRKK
jgi:hypothetical protein